MGSKKRWRRDMPPPVRLVADFGASALWYLDAPVDYEVSGLDEGFIAALRDWEESSTGGLDDEQPWGDERAVHAAGQALATRLADALGSDFAVEYEGGRIQSDAPPVAPRAAAAFAALVEAERADQEQAEQLMAGRVLNWSSGER